MFQNILLVFLGGGIGSLARYGVSSGVKLFPAGSFPVATLVANILSCVVMGITLSLISGKLNEQPLRLFIIAGICGGFSTFSTFSLETLELIRKGNLGFAAANIVVSMVLCMVVLSALIKK